jgi:hypothetical protein
MLDGFKNEHLKLKINNARTLLKSFQPIHRLINIPIKLQLIWNLIIKKWNIDNCDVDKLVSIFQELKNGYL